MATFTPRLNDIGMRGTVYYSGTTGGYYAMPNCTRYCYGRWWEIMQQQPNGLYGLGNGEDWWGNVRAYQKGSAPKLGAIICFADGPYSKLGHVAVLEQINSDGTYTFSNSGYPSWYFYTKTGSPANNYGYERAYKFQGFIYPPTDYDPDTPIPVPPSQFDRPLWFYIKRKPF